MTTFGKNKKMDTLEGAKALFLYATEGIIVVDDRGIIKEINPSGEKLFGFTKKELIGKKIEMLIPHRFTQRHKQLRREYNANPYSRPMGMGMDLCGMKKDGTELPVEISLTPYKTPEGKFVIVFITDITLRKQTEKKLIESEKRLRSMLEIMMEGAQIIGFDWKYLYVNDAVVKQGKYSKEELLGHSIMEKYPGIENTNVFRVLRKCMEERVSQTTVTNEFIFSEGSKAWFELSIHPVPEGIFILSIDITERKLAADKLKNYSAELEKQVQDRTLVLEKTIRELEKTEEELRQALKKEKEMNELKSRFVSMVSHEFRTPLATILSSLSLARKYGEQNKREKQEKHLNRIKASVNNLTDIITDVLSISKMEEGRMAVRLEQFDAQQFAGEVIREMQLMAKEGQQIHLVYSGNGEILFDKKILRHILFNLISNAIKFSPEYKSIEVKLDTTEQLHLQVKDEGIGIAKEDQKHLFDRFFRGENATNIQGTGLGLNIVAKYVELLDGTIECNSTLGKGTLFTMKLPLNHH